MSNAAFHVPPSAPASPRRNSYLFLRRFPGERIVVFDQDTEVWIQLRKLNLDTETATLAITGLEQPVELPLHGETVFLQGEGRVKFHTLQLVQGPGADYRAYASLGIRAPKTMLIRREELIRGTLRQFRANMRQR